MDNKYLSIHRNDENIFSIVNNRFHECLEIALPRFQINYTTEKKDYGEKIIDCYGIIGIVDLINASYLITITEVEVVFILFKREIYKIKNVEFILLEADSTLGEGVNDYFKQKPTSEEMEENKNICNNLRNIFINDFYFSNKYDLANSFSSHNQIIISKSNESSNAVIDYDHIFEGNRNFLANWKFINKLIMPKEKNPTRVFVSNCIYGDIECLSYDKKGENDAIEKIHLIIISRRNLMNFGLYNYKKGMSKTGYNSNLVETEIIMIYNNSEIYSNVFISSYMPIFFRNKPSYDQNNINKAFTKYFQGLIGEYNILVLLGLNALENDKKYFQTFKNFVIANKVYLEKKLKYFCINANKKTVKDVFKESKENGSNILEILGFAHNNSSLKTKNDFTQVGIMYLFGLNQDVMHLNEFFLTNKIISSIYKKISNCKITPSKDQQFVEALRIIFQRRKVHLMSQYMPQMDISYIQKQQRMLEIIFGKNIKDLKRDFNDFREDFSLQENIKIFIGSWNTASTNLFKHTNLNLDSWLLVNQEVIPNIYVVGLQEVVELNAGNIVLNLEDREKILLEWAKKIENSLKKIGNYKRLIAMNLVGINLYFYALEKDVDNITNLTKKYVKTGFGGAGNKGSCCINFNYYSTTISIACSHLAAGEKKNKQRLKEISDVLTQKISSFMKADALNILIDDNEIQEKTSSETFDINTDLYENVSYEFKQSDIWFLFGDLNFRIDMDYEEFSKFIKDGQNWEKLTEYDQFNKNQKASIEFTEIIGEDSITHPPSYKFMIGSDMYDYDSKEKNDEEGNVNLSGKKRNPSWCDRIFYKKNSFMLKDEKKVLQSMGFYNCIFDDNFQTSDHRPIFNIFDVVVFKDDEEKKRKMEKEVALNNKLNIKSTYFRNKIFSN